MMPGMKKLLVIDIPNSSTAEQMEAALNRPCADGYYLSQLIFSFPEVVRAFYRLRVKPEKEL
jgi:hypothetical protein